MGVNEEAMHIGSVAPLHLKRGILAYILVCCMNVAARWGVVSSKVVDTASSVVIASNSELLGLGAALTPSGAGLVQG